MCHRHLCWVDPNPGTLAGVFLCVNLPPLSVLYCRSPSEYISAILELSSLVIKRSHQLFLFVDFLYYHTADGRRFRKACDLVHNFTDAVIRERRHTLSSQNHDEFLKSKTKSKTLDFIDVLLLAKVCSCGIWVTGTFMVSLRQKLDLTRKSWGVTDCVYEN